MGDLWATFRSWPTWAQLIGWMIAWPVLAAVWLWSSRIGDNPLSKTVAVAVALVGGLFWSLIVVAVFGGLEEPSPTVEAVAPPVPPSPTPSTRPSPSPSHTPSPKPSASPMSTAPPEVDAVTAPEAVPNDAQPATVARIVDGDTIWVEVTEPHSGPLPAAADHKIRLLEYDSPEVSGGNECGGPEATEALREMIPVGARVWLVADKEDTDRYGRFLRYVWDDEGRFINRAMVRQGYGEAVLYEPNDAYIDELRSAQRRARQADLGIWGPPCNAGEPPPPPPEPEPEPEPEPTSEAPAPSGDCDPAYPDVCIPPPPPDLDCGDVPQYSSFRVLPPDPHGFDGSDNDGLGCESN